MVTGNITTEANVIADVQVTAMAVGAPVNLSIHTHPPATNPPVG